MKTVTLKEAWSGQANCLQCTIRSSVLFAGVSEESFHSIHQPIDQYSLKPGLTLYHAGDPGEFMFTIRSGLVKLVQYLPDGDQRIVRLARATDLIGLELLVEPRYHHEAVILQPTEVCRFQAAMVNQLSRDNPRLHRELMLRWHRALSEADAWLTELSTGSARARIARFVLRIVNGSKDSSCELFSREDMGAMLGITTETASRTVAEFKRQGFLKETSSNHFSVEVKKLRRIAED